MKGLRELTRRQSLRLFSFLGFLGFADDGAVRKSLADPAQPMAGNKPPGNALETCHFYPDIGDLDCSLFTLPQEGLDEDRRRHALQAMEGYLSKQKQFFLGYQGNQSLSYARELSFLLDINANNIADPFQNSNMTPNTKVMERAVLDYFATLWHASQPGQPSSVDVPSSYWGYVLSMGSTEGNLFGLYSARDYLSGRALYREPGGEVSCIAAPTPHDQPNAYRPVAFFSEDTHYSVIKILRTLAIDSFHQLGQSEYPGQCPFNGGQWPAAVPSQGGDQGPGAIDIGKLAELVAFFASKGHPIIVVLNYGTTFKGAYDDVRAAGEALEPILRKTGLFERRVAYESGHCDIRSGCWFHVDAALGAAYMPFLKMAKEKGLVQDAGPDFDFALPCVNSITMSGHKWLGAPVPCGVFMTLRKYQLKPPDDPEYIGAHDTTFAGSRSALAPALLWSCLARTSYEDQIRKAIRTQDLAAYAFEKLSALDRLKGGKLWVEHTPLALAVRFRAPSKEIIFRYSLPVSTMMIGGEKRAYVHIYLMDHVTKSLIDQLVEDLSRDSSYTLDKS